MKYLIGLLCVLIHTNLLAQFNTYESPYKAEQIDLHIETPFDTNLVKARDSVLFSTIKQHKQLIF